MNKRDESSEVVRLRHKQMLKLVARSFYHELVNYGVNQAEVLSVAGHLLDNVMQPGGAPGNDADGHNRLFTIHDVRDEWAAAQHLSVHDVTISPLGLGFLSQVA